MLDDNQNVLRTFSYYPGVDKPHSVMTDTATYYYATDPTGSVIGLAEFDGASSVVNHYRYDVWGMPQGSVTEGVANPIRFKARWSDADTELLDFRSRWYDPEIGRFISEDPIGLEGGINVYRFVGNDPVSGQDPFGMSEDWWCRWVESTIEVPQPINPVTGEGGESSGGTTYRTWECTWIGDTSPGGTTTTYVTPGASGGKGGSTGGSPTDQSAPEPRYIDLNQCIGVNASQHFQEVRDIINSPVKIQLKEGHGSVTVRPGVLLTGTFFGAGALVADGGLRTAARGAPSVGANGMPLRGLGHVRSIGSKLVKGVALGQAAFTLGLYGGSELVATAECLGIG